MSMYEDRPGHPGHNTQLFAHVEDVADNVFFPKGSDNEYGIAAFFDWVWKYPKGRGGRRKVQEERQPHITMLQYEGPRGGSGWAEVSLENLLKRWDILVMVYPEGTEYNSRRQAFIGHPGEDARVRVGELPGLTLDLTSWALRHEEDDEWDD
tara:strand:- start:1285 stop:1740 length:456 start_codon:yes stop_codon:yes gene_type:complete